MDQTELLAALYAIRSNPAYHAAETLRQKSSNTAAMAAPPGSKKYNANQYNAVVLLISTWETIALMMDGVKNKNRIFEVTPVGYMYDKLQGAIEKLDPNYSVNFKNLYKEYTTFFNNKDSNYQTAAKGGMHALFG
jgi:hypothetical protein